MNAYVYYLVTIIFSISVTNVWSQDDSDGIYGKQKNRKELNNEKQQNNQQNANQIEYSEEGYADDYVSANDYYEDDYYYTSRIRRFHQPFVSSSYFWGGYADPFFYSAFPSTYFSIGFGGGFGPRVGVGLGWGAPFCDPWYSFYDPWYNPWGWGYSPWYGGGWGWGRNNYWRGYNRGFNDGYFAGGSYYGRNYSSYSRNNARFGSTRPSNYSRSTYNAQPATQPGRVNGYNTRQPGEFRQRSNSGSPTRFDGGTPRQSQRGAVEMRGTQRERSISGPENQRMRESSPQRERNNSGPSNRVFESTPQRERQISPQPRGNERQVSPSRNNGPSRGNDSYDRPSRPSSAPSFNRGGSGGGSSRPSGGGSSRPSGGGGRPSGGGRPR